MNTRAVLFSLTLAVAAALAAGCGSDRQPSETPTVATSTAGATTTATSTATTAPTQTTAAAPTATMTISATATPQPTATAIPATGAVFEHGDRASNMVALTFDMGGRADPALDIMEWLIAHRTAATVFMTGAMADSVNTDAGRQVLRLIDAHRDEFALGNHSYSHPDFRTLTADQMRAELLTTETAIARSTAIDPRPLFRPPYGGQDASVVRAVAAAGYTRTVLWDVDTIDWEPESDGGPTTDEIVAKVLSNARGGSIVLMHLGGYHTFEALPAIVAGLTQKGFQLVTLSTLLGP